MLFLGCESFEIPAADWARFTYHCIRCQQERQSGYRIV